MEKSKSFTIDFDMSNLLIIGGLIVAMSFAMGYVGAPKTALECIKEYGQGIHSEPLARTVGQFCITKFGGIE